MSAAEDRAVTSAREKARERLKRRPLTVEQLRLLRQLLADEPPARERKAS